jgi:hypothetical protein
MADILGLNVNITKETLAASTQLSVRISWSRALLIRSSHNRLPSDTVLSKADMLILSDDFKRLCAIIAKHNAQSSFRLRLLHRHMPIQEGQILLGTRIMGAPYAPGYWIAPSDIPKDLSNIHGHIYVVDTSREGRGRLLPAEFREGPPASIESVDGSFFTVFIDYIETNGLENTFGLETIQDQSGKSIEFSFDVGNLLVEEIGVKADIVSGRREMLKLQETVWAITVDGETVCTTGESRCVKFSDGKHTKVTNTKAKSALDVLRILQDEDILVRELRGE